MSRQADLNSTPYRDSTLTPEKEIEEAIYDEKDEKNDIQTLSRDENVFEVDSAEVHGIVIGDPFPVDPNAPIEEYTLTVRAVLVGCILGAVVGAS